MKCRTINENKLILTENMFDQHITYSEPKLSIKIVENLTQKKEESRVAMDVFCCVDTAIGSPKFYLSCLGCQPDAFEIHRQNTTIEEHENYSYGIHYGVVHLTRTGMISCNITDNLGTYVVSRTIADQGEHITHIRPNLNSSWCV